MADKLIVTGARGASATEVARRVGAWGSTPTDNDAAVLEKFAQFAIEQNPGFQSVIPGPAGPTFLTLAAFKAAPVSNQKQALKAPGIPAGDFYWTGAYEGPADNVNVIFSDSDPTGGTGAWVRQGAGSILFHQSGTGAIARTAQSKLREVISIDDFGADPTASIDSYAALLKAIDACPEGGTLQLPGAYRISAPAGTTAITINKTMTIAGPGRRTGNISDGNRARGMLFFDSDVAVGIEIDDTVVTFDGVAIIGINYVTSTGDGVQCNGVSAGFNLVGGSVVQQFNRGIVADEADYCKIDRSSIIFCRTSISATGCYNFNIFNSHIRPEGPGSRGIVALDNSQINIFGGAVESYHEYGFLMLGGSSLSLSGVYLEAGNVAATNTILGDNCSVTERTCYVYMTTCAKHITVEGSGTVGYRIDSYGNIFVPESSSRRVDYFGFNQSQSTGQVVIDGHRFVSGLTVGANNNWLNPDYLADYPIFAQGVGSYRVNFPLSHANFGKGYNTNLDNVDPATATPGSPKGLTMMSFKASDGASDPIGIRTAYGPNAPYRAVYQNGQWEKVGLRLPNQADSAAGTVAALRDDLNALLGKLRSAGVML